jgi:thiamine-phosphate diphosphorylase
VIGASLGGERELENAKDADYVGIGPLFSSGSKHDAGEAIGIDGFKRLAALCELPAIAIGGITAERVPQLIEAGATGVAAINAIFKGADPEGATRLLAAAIGK